jgi:hypothetical protein
VEWIIAGAVVLALVPLGFVAQRKGWIDLSSRGFVERSKQGGAPLNGFDEVFTPQRYEIQLQQDAQQIMPAPAPIPGDGDKDVYRDGPVRIDVSATSDPGTRRAR